jgi:hypothetical protein
VHIASMSGIGGGIGRTVAAIDELTTAVRSVREAGSAHALAEAIETASTYTTLAIDDLATRQLAPEAMQAAHEVRAGLVEIRPRLAGLRQATQGRALLDDAGRRTLDSIDARLTRTREHDLPQLMRRAPADEPAAATAQVPAADPPVGDGWRDIWVDYPDGIRRPGSQHGEYVPGLIARGSRSGSAGMKGLELPAGARPAPAATVQAQVTSRAPIASDWPRTGESMGTVRLDTPAGELQLRIPADAASLMDDLAEARQYLAPGRDWQLHPTVISPSSSGGWALARSFSPEATLAGRPIDADRALALVKDPNTTVISFAEAGRRIDGVALPGIGRIDLVAPAGATPLPPQPWESAAAGLVGEPIGGYVVRGGAMRRERSLDLVVDEVFTAVNARHASRVHQRTTREPGLTTLLELPDGAIAGVRARIPDIDGVNPQRAERWLARNIRHLEAVDDVSASRMRRMTLTTGGITYEAPWRAPS